MTAQPPPDAVPPEPQAITANVLLTGDTAAAIRQLAAVEGRTPESLALQYAAGALTIPAEPIDASDWGFFDGPSDLAARADEYLRGGRGR
ncbi:hypothetical protein I5Q34_17465 [Streptomyces sp. AV19]|uniref:hypothetical protein n=1 Tax=Streptomyces sp. AV19 TaxID=2793068 RepID=UPI0018FE3637|nr:hypothetical protein [Streptomyces sp. AV19]MBH1936036.1 hypothetical protein [Streptomyces sp. AV19]MDG4534172.1 hypothetical protein [Streptomyces sp. AV19]